jgi:hypothetical protein
MESFVDNDMPGQVHRHNRDRWNDKVLNLDISSLDFKQIILWAWLRSFGPMRTGPVNIEHSYGNAIEETRRRREEIPVRSGRFTTVPLPG